MSAAEPLHRLRQALADRYRRLEAHRFERERGRAAPAGSAILLGALAVFGSLPVPCRAQSPAPAELLTRWDPPPGDRLEHETAGFAKILCSALFITGRELASAAAEDGFFVSPLEDRQAVVDTVVDRERHEVRLTLANGVTRTARQFGDQGCVTLPRGADSVFFHPVPVRSSLPPAESQPWPMGDRLPDAPFPPGLDSAKVAAAAAAAFDPTEALTAAFVVAYKGRIIAERYGPGMHAATRLPSWSMGKSITGTLIGQLVQEGVYHLWKPAPVAEWRRPGDPRHAIRLADLLRMSSGLRFVAPQDPDYDPARGYPDHLYVYTGAIDAFRWSVTRPPEWRPNTVGRYRNSDPLVLGYLIRKAVEARHQEYLSYPQRHLFDRLGIRHITLETDPYGNFLLNGYELATGRDWTRLGLLYLQDGMWQGHRLLPKGWADFVRTPAPAWSKPEYGAMFWVNRTHEWPVPEDAYSMVGAGGQYTIIIPTHDLVVARLGHYKGQKVGDAALGRALTLLMEAVPQVRSPWQPPAKDEHR
jgi:CubicO group peptidase (beta-lactamase class C family)